MRYENQEFNNEEIILDGNEYIGCTFNGCLLDSRGLTPTKIIGCNIIDSRSHPDFIDFMSDIETEEQRKRREKFNALVFFPVLRMFADEIIAEAIIKD